jgi:hypothetical protein
MNPINLSHIPIPRLRELFNATLIENDDLPLHSQLDIALNAPSSHFRLLHHILIARYAKVTMHHRDTPIPLVGLDIETNYLTGEPKLLGYSYPNGFYHSDDTPTLDSLYLIIQGIISNSDPGTQIVTWGNLDINCLIRLFDPTSEEKTFISKGYGGRFRNGEWYQKPPLMRSMFNGATFSIDHYISGRSLRLSVVIANRCRTIWIYNLSQFYPTRISETAKALGYKWIDYDESTHLIDWKRYFTESAYRIECLDSNRQDAQTVRMMADHLQGIFHKAFQAYPALLVSAGSLADAAVSKMLTPEEYESNSWQYLKYSTLGANNDVVRLAESLLSEAYSAGYVDQFSIGFHPKAFTVDISSAYPHKIRQLPDLRNCYMVPGSGNPNDYIKRLSSERIGVFTTVLRGTVTIPESLEYHPITVKTPQRQNIRPIGTFRAAYFIEERDFCEKYGATFTNEEWVIFALKENVPAPIAKVSQALADMRDSYRAKLDDAKKSGSDEEIIFYDSLQYMVKVVDNSLYGKNVMATEIVEEINGKPVVVGLKAGDRFNQLYGGWITALTRTQLAQACMDIQTNGGLPILAMTDSVYWTGTIKDLPQDVISHHGKVAGKFESPEVVEDMFLVKTGQYEYRKGKQFYHKMRGLNLPYEDRSSNESFYRKRISEWLLDKSPHMHPEDVEIPVNTRKLVTVGIAHDPDTLGMVADGTALMKPYVLSGKQVERFVHNYRETLDKPVRLRPAVAGQSSELDSPLEFLSGLNERGGEYITRHQRKRIFYLLIVKVTGMTIGNRFNGQMPDDKVRLTEISWNELEMWSGIKREWARL